VPGPRPFRHPTARSLYWERLEYLTNAMTIRRRLRADTPRQLRTERRLIQAFGMVSDALRTGDVCGLLAVDGSVVGVELSSPLGGGWRRSFWDYGVRSRWFMTRASSAAYTHVAGVDCHLDGQGGSALVTPQAADRSHERRIAGSHRVAPLAT